jgi:shikimate dehydrogenase
MPDRYAVVGNPVAHSKSPQIHAAFAHSTGADMSYERLLAPLDGFVAAVEAFRREGGRGLNVTVPFKVEAFALASLHSSRAQLAGAVNTLMLEPDGRWYGDNTDGAGLVRDLTENLGLELRDRSILVLGAGGAARGILGRSPCPTGPTPRRRRSPPSSRRSAPSRPSPPRRSPGAASTS